MENNKFEDRLQKAESSEPFFGFYQEQVKGKRR